MNQPNHSAPRVAVIGSGLGPCQHVPGFRVDVIDGDTSTARDARRSGSYDLLHLACAEPAGIAAVEHDDAVIFLSPGRAGDRRLAELGITPQRIHRWRPGVDRERFTPAAYHPLAIPAGRSGAESITVLHVGAFGSDLELSLLMEAFRLAHQRDERLHLLVAGDGPSQDELRLALDGCGILLGPLNPDELARVYATADLLVHPSPSDLLAQNVLEAQASGLAVLAVDGGGAADLIESGRSGCLVEPTAGALAEAIYGLGRRAKLRERLVTGALMSLRGQTWDHSLERLATVWSIALGAPANLAGLEPARAA